MTWRTIQDAYGQWCPLSSVPDITTVSTAPPEGQLGGVASAPNRIFTVGAPNVGTLLMTDLGQGYAAIGCIADLCSFWESSTESVGEGEDPPGRCALPNWTEHQQRRT